MDAPIADARSISEFLNQECFCITLDRDALCDALEREVGDAEFCATFIRTRPHLFSNAPVFISKSETIEMLRIVRAIEAATRLPGYRRAALSWAPEFARHDFGPRGVFMGFDFHVGAAGPRLIEVNTNAGGAFLNALLADAQRACCAEIEAALGKTSNASFESAVLRMFQHEFKLQRQAGALGRIAIVDDRPEEQYLYPEFVLAQRFFVKHGIEAVIADAGQLRYARGMLTIDGRPIDLVYNRLVDFPLIVPGTRLCERPISTMPSWLRPIRIYTPCMRTSAISDCSPTRRRCAAGGFRRRWPTIFPGCRIRWWSRPTMRLSFGREGRRCSSNRSAGTAARVSIAATR
jgi:hypothetical protein